MATNMATEVDNVVNLKGSPQNPAREPKAKTGKGSIGDVGLTDAMKIVVVAWLILLFLAWSLRHHNV